MAVVASIALPASAQAQAFQAWGGSDSCATWQSDSAHREAGNWWIWGFWSGRNSGRTALVGRSTDANGVIAEIKLTCQAQPSMTIVQATIAVYERMRAAGK